MRVEGIKNLTEGLNLFPQSIEGDTDFLSILFEAIEEENIDSKAEKISNKDSVPLALAIVNVPIQLNFLNPKEINPESVKDITQIVDQNKGQMVILKNPEFQQIESSNEKQVSDNQEVKRVDSRAASAKEHYVLDTLKIEILNEALSLENSNLKDLEKDVDLKVESYKDFSNEENSLGKGFNEKPLKEPQRSIGFSELKTTSLEEATNNKLIKEGAIYENLKSVDVSKVDNSENAFDGKSLEKLEVADTAIPKLVSSSRNRDSLKDRKEFGYPQDKSQMESSELTNVTENSENLSLREETYKDVLESRKILDDKLQGTIKDQNKLEVGQSKVQVIHDDDKLGPLNGKFFSLKEEKHKATDEPKSYLPKDLIHNLDQKERLTDGEKIEQVQQKNDKVYEPVEHKHVRIQLEDTDINIRVIKDNLKVSVDFKSDVGYIFRSEINKLAETLNSIGFRLEALQVNGSFLYSDSKQEDRKDEKGKHLQYIKGKSNNSQESFELSI